MKKRLSLILIAVMTAMLLYGCGGASTGTANNKSKETASTETAQTPVQEETSEATAPSQEETSEANAPAQGETSEAPVQEETDDTAAPAQEETTAAPAEAEETSGTPTGFKVMSMTSTGRSGARVDIVKYDQDGDVISIIANDDENKAYYVQLIEKIYDEDGKWVSSTIYEANQETAIDPENTDIFKTEEKITATETCFYEDDGLVVEKSDSSGTVIQKDTYNEKHQKVLSQGEINTEVPTTAEFKYDEQGILIEEKIESGGSVQIVKYTPIGVTNYQTSIIVGYETISEKELKYDENGVPVGAISANARTGESFDISFELDEYGNLTGTSTKDGDTVISSTEYEIVSVNE